MKKKLTAFLLSMSMLPAVLVTAKSTESTFENDIRLLSAFGIIDGESDIAADGYVTRGEFAEYLAEAMKITPMSATSFSDISEEQLAAVSALEKYNIVYGNGSEFRPDDIITNRDALVMIMRALGYEKAAVFSGGYPGGYLSYADSVGVTDGLGGKTEDYADMKSVATMLSNMLEAELYVVKAEGGNSYSYEQGETFMEKYYDAYKTTGILQGNNKLNINGSSSEGGENMVMFNYREYQTELDLDDMLGYKLTVVYISDDGENSIIYAEESKQNNVYTMSGYDDVVFDLDGFSMEYTDGNKTKKLKFYNGTNFILNGEFVSDIDNSDVTPRDGAVKAVDNNADGKIDVFFIDAYDYAVAERVSVNEEFILDKISDQKLGADDEDLKITLDGEEQELKDIPINSLLELVKDTKGEIKEIHIYEALSGTCAGFGEDEIFIDGEAIELSDFFLDKKAAGKTERIVNGNSVTYWKNSGGKVVWATCDVAEKYLYGYLINIYTDDDTERVVFKLLTESGNVERITLTEKVKLNEVKTDADKLATRTEFTDDLINIKRQLIMYSKNSGGEMNRILTAKDTVKEAIAGGADQTLTESYGDIDAIFKNKDEFSLDYYPTNDVRYVKGQFDSTYGITSDTVIFNVPNPSILKTDDKDFYIGSTSQFEGDKKYNNLYFYDFNEVLNAAAMITYRSKTETISGTVLLVDSVTTIVDESDEIKPLVKGYQSGKAVEYIGEDMTYVSAESHWGTASGKNYTGIGWEKLKKGDILQLGLNKEGEIEAYRIVAHDLKNLNTDYMLGGYSSITVIDGRDSYGGTQFCSGKVTKTGNGYIFVNTKTTTGLDVVRRLKASGNVYKMEKNKLTQGAFDDISKGDKVAVMCSFDIPVATVIVGD